MKAAQIEIALLVPSHACQGFVIILGAVEEEFIPMVSGKGEAFMDVPGTPAVGTRRNEDIALDLMKFIAVTTGYGKSASPSGGVGFEKSGGGASKPEDYAASLLQLYGKCLDAVAKK